MIDLLKKDDKERIVQFEQREETKLERMKKKRDQSGESNNNFSIRKKKEGWKEWLIFSKKMTKRRLFNLNNEKKQS